MKLRSGVLGALLLLAACTETETQPGNVLGAQAESSHAALGVVPPTEVAAWTRVGPADPGPGWRYLQAAAFDETRKVLMMFGGFSGANSSTGQPGPRDLWEWDPGTATWTNRTPTGDMPNARGGASMVFDSIRNNLVVFGGSAGQGNGYVDYADIWEWDAQTGVFSDRTKVNQGPGFRSEQSMVFEKSTGKVLLFGGAAIAGGTQDGNNETVAVGDTWEWDPVQDEWNQLQPQSAPSARYDSALVWDSKRNLAVLFGGMEQPQVNLNGIPKQDLWEWDPAAQVWTNRTTSGPKPSARYGHAMAYDPGRGVTVVVGGWDINTGNGLADVWEWDPTSMAWTQRLDGSEANLPPARMYASLVTDTAHDLLDLVGGLTASTTTPPLGEIWVLDPNSATFTNRTPPPPPAWPEPRSFHAMSFCPVTGKTYMFGGQNDNSALLDDLWEWNGSAWIQVASDVQPAARMNAAMAYDPSRKSLILYGGTGYAPVQSAGNLILGDTWEWNPGTRKWGQLFPASSPEPRDFHSMVTDSGRATLLLFGGERPTYNYTYPPPGSPPAPDSLSNAVWEWDGVNTTWTNRTPTPLALTPLGRERPLLSFDDGRQKMLLIANQWDNIASGDNFFWEWDPVGVGWLLRDSGDVVDFDQNPTDSALVAYDSLRRRHIVPIGGMTGAGWTGSDWEVETWELDAQAPTWYMRALSPGPDPGLAGAAMAFDSQRGVLVLFGGMLSANTNDTWEYKATNLGNGEGCTAATASNCASGFCVDGVCCASGSCSGVCQSCAVNGYAGTCAPAAPGTEVSGSCGDGQACDGSGKCKIKNGLACASASVCASGFCVDGVCCESACDGTCMACSQAGLAGKCLAYTAGSDPESECGTGSDPCRMVCNGAGACDAPQLGTQCGPCQVCDGVGTCSAPDPSVCSSGDAGTDGSAGAGGNGAGGNGAGGTGGNGAGGFGGDVTGGAGGSGGTIIGGRGGADNFGGTVAGSSGSLGGTVMGGVGSLGGSAGGGTISGGRGGSGNLGGATSGGAGGSGGTTTIGGAGGATAAGGVGGAAGSRSGGASGGSGQGGAGGSPDGGRDAIPPDTGSPDGRSDSISAEAGGAAQLHHAGCDCDMGQSAPGRSGLPLALLGAAFLWRRLRRRRLGIGAAAALLLLATCSENDPKPDSRVASSHSALGTVPATESATWTRVDAPPALTPNPRYLQSAAFDETRNVLVMFGGWSGGSYYSSTPAAASQELWEWNPATGQWSNRTPAGSKPSPRVGASMVFDSTRNNFVIFGGRSTTGFDFEDTWEWDPVGGGFTDRSASGPSGRSQHSMVFEKSTGNVLLFGGGLADSGSSIWPEEFPYDDPQHRPGPGQSLDGTGVSLAFGDTWEWNPSKGTWTQLAPTTAPSARYDSALVWDSKRSRAVLFGGMQKDQADADGIPQQDLWEWDPTTPGWNLRTTTGKQPSARWGHAMAYDSVRGMTVVAGGKDFQTYLGLADVWDWDPSNGTWAQRLTGSEASLPVGRMYASLVADAAANRLDLVAGAAFHRMYSGTVAPYLAYVAIASGEIWELEPDTATFTNRTVVQNAPSGRAGFAMAFCPATGKTYLFGGSDDKQPFLDDLWEWNGSSWSQVQSDVRPPGRMNTAMAYDPVRSSLILFGGENGQTDSSALPSVIGDTWEWNSSTRQWSQLFPTPNPGPQDAPSMATDLGREKVLLFGASATNSVNNSSAVWEWDGSQATWTSRTPIPGTVTPGAHGGQLLTFDEGRQKMFLFEGQSIWAGTTSNSVFWEWDPISAGWAFRDSGDFVDLGIAPFPVVAYDSLRRRQVMPSNATITTGATTASKTWELDTNGPTWYMRALAIGPTSLSTANMVFDSKRGVMVLFGAGPDDGSDWSETWEYTVANLGNGEGCTAATALNCTSGFCVDGVCCGVAACSGTCQSCAVAGHQGTCSQVAAGTEVPGSCGDGQACDGSGICNAKNGTSCSSASVCASGFCVDGVCCESVCDGTCLSCNQADRAGKCSAYLAGSDPQNECGLGSGLCRSTCNGAGACDYPQAGTPCGTCQTCDGNGSCMAPDPSQCGAGGAGGTGGTGAAGAGGTGAGGVGGMGGNTTVGGAGGMVSGGAGGSVGTGGTGVGGSGGQSGLGGGSSGGASGSGGLIGFGGTMNGGAGGSNGTGGTIIGGAGGNVGTSAGGGTSGTGGAGGSSGSGGGLVGDAGGYSGAGGASGSPDGGGDSPASDAGSRDGRRDSIATDTGNTIRLGHSGCDCDLRSPGQTGTGAPGLPFAWLGVALVWRRLRRRR